MPQQKRQEIGPPGLDPVGPLYEALRLIDRSIARSRSRESLLHGICSNLVQFGGLGLSWIDRFDSSSEHFHTVARAGAPDVFLDQIKAYAPDISEGLGLAGRAIRTGQPYVCNDLLDHLEDVSLRESAIRYGLRALGIFPLYLREEVFGVLCVCASTAGFFQEREIELIEQASDDISFSLEAFEQRYPKEKSRTEIALESAQAEIQAVIGDLDEGLIIAGPDGTILKCNAAALRLIGISEDQTPQEHLSDFVNLIELSTLAGVRLEPREWPTARIQRGETLRNLELSLRPVGTDKTTILSYSGSLVRIDPDRALLFIRFQDISDRKASEKTIRHLASFPEYDPDVVFELGHGLDVKYLNPAMQSAMEKSGVDDPAMFLPDSWKARLVNRTPIYEETDTFHFKIGERTYLGRIRYLPQFGSLRVYGTDITDLVSVQTALQSAQAEVEVVVENLNEGLIISDLQGNFLRRNAAALSITGIAESKSMLNFAQISELIEIRTLDGKILGVEDWPLQRVLRGETLSNFEARVRRHDTNNEKILSYHGSIVKYDTGKEIAFLKFQDVTQRKRAEASLREAQVQLFQAQKMEAIGQLAGGIAHDFNNALSVILGYGEMLAERLASDERSLRFVNQILLAQERAAALTRQLLMFSRKQVCSRVKLNLNEVIDEMLEMIQRVVGANAIVKVDRDQDLSCVLADRVQIEQVLLNLCLNARDAMPDGGTLTIRTSNVKIQAADLKCSPDAMTGLFATVSISDTGCGMDSTILERIFEPFFTTKEPGRGTGLGLSTSFGIVENNGGRISAESEQGKGKHVYNLFASGE